ncbi:hypothetical protein [Nocardia thailandica]
MRIVGLIAAGIAATVLATGVAHADDTDAVEFTDSGENLPEEDFGGDYAIDRDNPGSCLVVQNHTGKTVTLRLNYPASRGSWRFAHDNVGVLTSNGRVVTSPSGRWHVRTNPPIRYSWDFDRGLNRARGCNGSWVLTMN